MHAELPEPTRAESAAPAAKSPRRWIAGRLLAPAVAIALAAMLGASAWDALRPATAVEVTPAVFVYAEPDGAVDPATQPEPGGPAGRAAQAAGWIEADPFFVACSTLADGVVAEVLALEGERVEAGQIVARLVDDDARLALVRAEAQLALSRADLRAAEVNLTAAQADWDNPIERDRMVSVSQAQLDETEAEISQLPSLIAAERASLERLRDELARLVDASGSGAASPFQLMIVRRQTEAQQAVVDALVGRGPILGARRDRLRAELTAARRNAELRIAERRALDSAEAERARAQAAVADAEAARDEARLRLERMTIAAPISGLVQRRLKAPGDKAMLNMDDPHSSHILHLFDPEHLQVRVDVPLADAAGIVVGQRCEIVVEVLPDRAFDGEVTRITHEADLQKNTLEIKVSVIDPSPILKPEMLARVKFLAGGRSTGEGPATKTTGADPVRVPESAIVSHRGAPAAWVVRDRRQNRGVVAAVGLQVGERTDGWAEVTGELRPGDLLVTSGGEFSAGQRVRIVAAERGAG